MSNEKFCLRWNDFENNISNAFKELRDDKDFFDVTLACDDEQIPAHKVILAACSPFFRNILRRNNHQHPLLYMKGVKFSDLQAVLNFMYHGEVNVAQEELNSFLAVAEDLRVKGLTQTQSAPHQSPNRTQLEKSSRTPPPAPRINHRPPDREPSQISKRPRHISEEIQEVVPIKSEPLAEPPQQVYNEHAVSTYQEDTGYEDYGDYQDQGYSEMDTAMDHTLTVQGAQGQGQHGKVATADPTTLNDYIKKDPNTGLFVCTFCGKQNMQKNNIRKHIEGVHFTGSFVYKCDLCNKDFNGKNSLSTHMYKYHGNVSNNK